LTYNGLANSRFHTLLFGINRLRSDELPHCWAKSPCSGAFVQLLCNQNFNALPCRSTPFTTVNYGESYGSDVRRLARPVTTSAFVGTNPTSDSFWLARQSGIANCQRELRFPLSAGRRSAHFSMASSVGQRDCPHDVRRYSTFGGTWGYAVRTTIPSAANPRSCCPSIF
jgi:hypothetical protein